MPGRAWKSSSWFCVDMECERLLSEDKTRGMGHGAVQQLGPVYAFAGMKMVFEGTRSTI